MTFLIFASFMKKYWSDILMYGLTLGLLLAALEVLQYKWIFLKNSTDLYVGIIAVLFLAVGLWAGNKLYGKKGAARNEPFEVSEAAIAKLGITPRELEVLQLMAQGHSNQQIAEQLFVSLNTVKTHISNVLSKLNAARRTQAIQKAKTLGLIS